MKILLVDDDESTLALMSASLSAVGFEDICTALTATEAIGLVQANPEDRFGCISLDIEMPGMDGIELCRWLRHQPQHYDTPIIMVTVRSDSAHVDRAFAAGASDYLGKPFEIHQFCACITRIAESGYKAPQGHGGEPFELPDPAPLEDKVGFSVPISLKGVEGLSSHGELVKHVMQISRSDLLKTRTFAFKIGDAGKIYAQTTHDQYISLLANVAQAIASSLQNWEFQLAYAGEGVFLCVVRADARYDPVAIELGANLGISSLGFRDGHDRPLNVKLHSGSHLRSGAFRTGLGALDMFPRAIRSAVDDAHAAHEAEEGLQVPYHQNAR